MPPRPLSIQRSVSANGRQPPPSQPPATATPTTIGHSTSATPTSPAAAAVRRKVMKLIHASASPSAILAPEEAQRPSLQQGAAARGGRRSSQLVPSVTPVRALGSKPAEQQQQHQQSPPRTRSEAAPQKPEKTVSELQLEYDLLAETLTARQQETVLLCRLLCAIYSKWQQMVKSMPQQLVTQEVEEEAEEEEEGEDDDTKEERRRRRHSHSREKKERRRSGSSDSPSSHKRRKDKKAKRRLKKRLRTFLPIKPSTHWEALELPTEWISYFQLYYPIPPHQKHHRESSVADIPLLVDVLPSNYWEQLVDGAQRVVRGMDGLLHGGGGDGGAYTAEGGSAAAPPPPLPPQPESSEGDAASSLLSFSREMVRERGHRRHHHHHHRHGDGESVEGSSAVRVYDVREEGPQELRAMMDQQQQQQQQPSSSHRRQVALGSGYSSSTSASSHHHHPASYAPPPLQEDGEPLRASPAFSYAPTLEEEEAAAAAAVSSFQPHLRQGSAPRGYTEDQVHADVARLAEARAQALETQLRQEREARQRAVAEARQRNELLQQQLAAMAQQQPQQHVLPEVHNTTALPPPQQLNNNNVNNNNNNFNMRREGEEGGGKKKSIWTQYADTLLDEERRRMEQLNAHSYARRQASSNNNNNHNAQVGSFLFDAEKDVVLRTKLYGDHGATRTPHNRNPIPNSYPPPAAEEDLHMQNEIERNKAIIAEQFSEQQLQQQRRQRSAGRRMSPTRDEGGDELLEDDVCPLERRRASPPHWEQMRPGMWAAATSSGFGVSRATSPPAATATAAAAAAAALLPPSPSSRTRVPAPLPRALYDDARRHSPLSIQRSVSAGAAAPLNSSANDTSPPPRAPTFRVSAVLTHSSSRQGADRAKEKAEFDTIEQKRYFNDPTPHPSAAARAHGHPVVVANTTPSKSADATQLLLSPIVPTQEEEGEGGVVRSENPSPQRLFSAHRQAPPPPPPPLLPANEPRQEVKDVVEEGNDEDGEEEELSGDSTEPMNATRNATKVYNHTTTTAATTNILNNDYVTYWSSAS